MPNRLASSSSAHAVDATTGPWFAGRAAHSLGPWIPARPRAGLLGLGGLALAILLAGCGDSSTGPAAEPAVG